MRSQKIRDEYQKIRLAPKAREIPGQFAKIRRLGAASADTSFPANSIQTCFRSLLAPDPIC